MPVPGTENYYKIVQDAASERPPGLAVEGSNKVIHSNLPGEWLVVPIFGNNIYESVPLSNFTFVLRTNLLYKNSYHDRACQSSWGRGTRGEAEFRVH